MTSAPASPTRIVIVGGGAGGLELATRLGGSLGREVDVLLVEQNRTHTWKPLLHEVAAGSLDANLDEVGYRSHCHRWKYRFFCGTFEGIDREKRQVLIAPIIDEDGSEIMGHHRLPYDYLVLAIGSVSNDFGTRGVAQHCLFLDSRADADRFRNRLLNHCMRVSRTMSVDPAADAHVRVAIIGGGATGVELAAELYNAASALRYYGLDGFDENRLQVTLLEAGARILPALPESLADAARAELEALGVKVMTSMAVVEATEEGMVTAAGDVIGADLKIWAAGVKASPVLKDVGGLETSRNNQLVVRPTLQTTRDDRIFAIGDCAYFVPEGGGPAVPPRAQAAHQMAATAFHNLKRLLSGRPLKSFHYHDHGSLISLSRFSTVGSLMGGLVGGRMAIEGRLARFVYVSLYRMHLIAIHGWIKGIVMIVVSQIEHIIRPRLKLH